jgi:FixJ family two-component response regulator
MIATTRLDARQNDGASGKIGQMAAKADSEPVVFVVDDDDALRDALASLLRSVGLQVRTFATGAEFLAHPRSTAPACLVLDVRLPGLGGLDLQRELTRRGIAVPVIFVTGHGDIPMAVHAMKAGAVEFLVKPFREQDLLDAVGTALKHEREAMRERAAIAALRARFASLSSREREVLARVARGMRNKQVAADLGVSEVTVKLHRHRLMQKMEARTLASLVSMYDRLSSTRGDGAD